MQSNCSERASIQEHEGRQKQTRVPLANKRAGAKEGQRKGRRVWRVERGHEGQVWNSLASLHCAAAVVMVAAKGRLCGSGNVSMLR